MNTSQQLYRICGIGSESRGEITVFAPCDGSGMITAYDKHGNMAFQMRADASGMNKLNMVLPEGDYSLQYFTEPFGEGGQMYEGSLTVIA